MNNKELQKKRTMQYFIDAAKQIFEKEGIENLSVRKVADIAGYSYATIYNYFKDVNHLIWYVDLDILNDIGKHLKSVARGSNSGYKKVLKIGEAYITYFIDHPHVYELLFMKKLGEPPEDIMAVMNEPSLDQIIITVLRQCVEDGNIEEHEIPVIADMLIGTVHGLLLFYFIDTRQVNEEILFEKMNNCINHLLKHNAD